MEADNQYPENLHKLHNDLPFFSWKNENWKSWETYVIYIRNLKQALNHELVLKKCIESLDFIQNFG